MNPDGKEDVDLAQQTETSLHIEQPTAQPSPIAPTNEPVKKSLSALAAAARKPVSTGQSKISDTSAPTSHSNRSPASQGLSKLAAKAQQARRPHSNFVSSGSSKGGTLSDAANPAGQGKGKDGTAQIGESAPKLSKLQRRIQHGSKARKDAEVDTIMAEEDLPEEKDVWRLPATSLFSSLTSTSPRHSVFAEVIAPDHGSHVMDAKSNLITVQAVNAGRDALSREPARGVPPSTTIKSQISSQKPVRK